MLHKYYRMLKQVWIYFNHRENIFVLLLSVAEPGASTYRKCRMPFWIYCSLTEYHRLMHCMQTCPDKMCTSGEPFLDGATRISDGNYNKRKHKGLQIRGIFVLASGSATEQAYIFFSLHLMRNTFLDKCRTERRSHGTSHKLHPKAA